MLRKWLGSCRRGVCDCTDADLGSIWYSTFILRTVLMLMSRLLLMAKLVLSCGRLDAYNDQRRCDPLATADAETNAARTKRCQLACSRRTSGCVEFVFSLRVGFQVWERLVCGLCVRDSWAFSVKDCRCARVVRFFALGFMQLVLMGLRWNSGDCLVSKLVGARGNRKAYGA